MRLHKKQFIAMLKREYGGISEFCAECGFTKSWLIRMLHHDIPFGYEESKTILYKFGAAAMIPVINWEGMNVRCPI